LRKLWAAFLILIFQIVIGTDKFLPLSKLPNFDPRRVPSIGVDSSLPAITSDELSPEALINRFKSPPQWAPELRQEPLFTDRPASLASVLIPIVRRSQPTVLLTQRTAHLNNHSGQIAFPGGKADPSDHDPVMTALREANEEVGLEGEEITVLGTLPIYSTGSAFVITPVVALIDPRFIPRPNTNEVADIFEVPLAFLMNPSNHHRHVFTREGFERKWFSMPYQDLNQERYIWGATAGMLRNFYRFLAA
jgi:8-oxo-dGTP pyrophosphatase MutT (NUDIX family)